MGWKFVEYERVLGLFEVACSLVLSSFTCRTRQLHIRPVAPAHTCTLSRCPIECYPAYFCVTHTPTCLIKGRVRDAVIENLAITFSRPNLINGLEKVIVCPPRRRRLCPLSTHNWLLLRPFHWQMFWTLRRAHATQMASCTSFCAAFVPREVEAGIFGLLFNAGPH